MLNVFRRANALGLMLGLCALLLPMAAVAQVYLDNETIYSNQDPETETRRSEHFRVCFGHFNRDSGMGGMTEALAQGNLQLFEHCWTRWVVEMGMHHVNSSISRPNMGLRKANFHFLMTWNDGGGGGAYMSMDSNGFAYAMANPGYCRYDPPSGATPHEFGHVYQGTTGGFNGSDSSGPWWESHANWMMLQVNNAYPQGRGYIYNGNYYPAHGRHFYDNWAIFETALDDPRYGAAWVNEIWTNANSTQRQTEYMLDRMIRLDWSGSADKAGGMKDLWGDMAKKLVTWDFSRQRWLAGANLADDGSDWEFYHRARTPLVPVPGNPGWFRAPREHIPQQFGFNIIPLNASANTTVSCDFQPVCDPVRQSDWRACLVSVSNNGDARYSSLWNKGVNSLKLSNDESKLYLVVIATPIPRKVSGHPWNAYRIDSGSQFPYAVSFANASPKQVVWPRPTGVTWKSHTNLDGTVCSNIQSSATVDSTAYVSPNAMVLNTAQIRNYARVEDYAVVRNTAQVRDYAVVSGYAVIEGASQVYGNAKVRDWGRVFNGARVYDNAKVIEHAYVGDSTNLIFGGAVLKGTSSIYSPSNLSGSLICDGDTSNGGTGDKGVHFGWAWGQDPSRFTSLTDNGYIYAQHTFEVDNPIWAWDQFGINHGFLMNGAMAVKDTVTPTRGGRVLALDGANQYVELHSSVNDWRETAVTVWTKWTGAGDNQRIWSMGDGANKQMYLTPRDSSTGKLRFVISNGATTQYLDGAAAMPTNAWTHVAVVFSSPVFNTTSRTWSSTGTLYVNGAQVATQSGMVVPESVSAPLMQNANYLGRGNAGNYFQGFLDDFRVYMKSLTASEVSSIYSAAAPGAVTIPTDTTPPTPNAATWLVAPFAISDNAITMSATMGTDASNWVEYYFQCTSGGGPDSGWVSFNKYTAVGLTPGTTYTYTVRMRDKNGNTTASSVAANVTTQTSTAPAASFSYGPVGIANGQITMRANKVSSPSGLVEYKFDRVGSSVTSGWQSSPRWTNTGLTTGATYSYTVTVRDGRGNVSAPSDAVSTSAKDVAAPELPIPVAHWETLPYATIDNRVCMTAMSATDASSRQYKFFCVSGGGPDSAWQSGTKWTSGVLPSGTYVYRYKVRDTSAQYNESDFSTAYSVTVSPYRGYHAFPLIQLASLPDDYLVDFNGTIVQVNSNNYIVRDLASGASIKVTPNAGKSDGSDNRLTNAALAMKNVNVKGHLYTFSGTKVVTFATVTSTGDPTLRTISGRVTNTSGAGIANATVYFSYTPNASTSPFVTATTDSNGYYSRGLIEGTWYVCAGSPVYNTSADQVVTLNGANVGNVNFTLAANMRISGKVTRKSDGTAISGAKIYFSQSPNASGSPVFTATANANGEYTQAVQNGTWYVCAGATSFFTSADRIVVMASEDIAGIDFVIKPSTRNIPRTEDLLVSAITESLPASGSTGNWATYMPAGQTLTAMGSPTVETVGGMKWEQNIYGDGDGFRWGSEYQSSIPINGATIVLAARPIRSSDSGNWRSIVDIFYDRLVFGVHNNSGQVCVRRNGSLDTAASNTAIPNGQVTILSLVVQPNGTYRVFANGTQIMNITSTSTFTSLVPGVAGSYARFINIGRNNPDGWTTFNGNIGDVFIYKAALTDAERQQLEADLINKFNGFNITASAGSGGTISPNGLVAVNFGESQTFTITPDAGYMISDVKVNNVSVGAVSSYTFSNITANHTISATFAVAGEAVASIDAIKAKAAGTLVRLTGSATVIYAPRNASNVRSTNFFYIGEKQALGGLKVVDKTSDNLNLGNQVSNLTGYVRKPAGGEVYLELITDPTGSGNTPILPLGMNNKTVLTDAKAQTNAVRVWGKVKSVNGTTSFTINDGDAGNVTVILNGVALPAGFASGKTAVVTGLVTKDSGGSVVVFAQAVRVL